MQAEDNGIDLGIVFRVGVEASGPIGWLEQHEAAVISADSLQHAFTGEALSGAGCTFICAAISGTVSQPGCEDGGRRMRCRIRYECAGRSAA